MRFEPMLDCGDDCRLACWEVIEWDWSDAVGNRSGQRVAYARDEQDAVDQAAVLNAAYEREQFTQLEKGRSANRLVIR